MPNIDKLIASVRKKHGDESVLSLLDNQSKVETISTGIASIDRILGGGLPKGRIIEVLGAESSAKTTFVLSCIAQSQKEKPCVLIDAEHAFDPSWARTLGVNTDELIFSQPTTSEECLEIAESFIESGEVGIVVIDSVAAMVPSVELQGDFGQSNMGVMARLMSQACRKLTGMVANTGTILIFVNQIRYKIGVLYGNPETTPGGNALKFYSSVRLDFRRGSSIKAGEETIGTEIKVKTIKNKVAAPFRKCTFSLNFETGIDVEHDFLTSLLDAGIIEKKGGGWMNYGDVRLGQGETKALEFIENNPELKQEFELKLKG